MLPTVLNHSLTAITLCKGLQNVYWCIAFVRHLLHPTYIPAVKTVEKAVMCAEYHIGLMCIILTIGALSYDSHYNIPIEHLKDDYINVISSGMVCIIVSTLHFYFLF